MGASAALLTWNPTQAFAATAAEKKAEAAAALDKLDAMKAKLASAEADFELALSEQLAAQSKMEESQAKIDEATERIGDLQDHLGTRARSMYRTGSSSFLDLLLGATTFQAFTTNWGILNDMNQSDADMVEETKTLRAEVEEQKQVYVEQEKVASEKAEKAAQVQAESKELVDQVQATYNSLSAEVEQLVAAEEQARENESARRAQEELATMQNSGGNSGSNSGNKNPGNSGSSGNSSNGNSLPPAGAGPIARAEAMIGRPYVTGGVGPNSFDCSGFLGYCYTGEFRRIGTTYDIFARQPTVTNPQPGDFVWSWDHVGLYVGGGMMIHASYSKGQVVRAPVYSGLIYKRWVG